MGRDFKQRTEQLIFLIAASVMSPKVLNCSCPIEVCHQPGVSEAEAFRRFRRRDVEKFLESRAAPHLVDPFENQDRCGQASNKESCRDCCYFARRLHFRFLYSKTQMAANKTIAE